MSVLEHKTAVKMLFATIPKVPISVHVNVDILGMDGLAKVNVTKALILLTKKGMETKDTNLKSKNDNN